ncbi:hypothetical protein F8388_014096 [Cannabis sativa]|uniref:Cotton fiber protein n=1 Tax=Cannabis sativa TaxID=3483 RepID=A0A7J6GKZ0_CANSA|nr:hypothetical protein G4B88_006611 [Cannabis sativa]KAF4383596.1 hypothetical protein F8388_014096 [Cannabis sativa]
MPRKSNDVAGRAWNILRLALLWARKGGVFKRRLMTELRLLPKLMKSIGHDTPKDRIRYGERQLSFDKTPIFPAIKINGSSSMRHFHIPCLNPPTVDFDYDFDGQDDDVYYRGYCKNNSNNDDKENDGGRKSFLIKGGDGDVNNDDNEFVPYDQEENIDTKAEEFITKFYQQMKMQRQISYLQYNNETITTTPRRSIC